MMALLHNAAGEGAYRLLREGALEVPKLILAAVAWLHKPGTVSATDAHDARYAATRSREATRRLRESGGHEPYFDLSPLDLARRH
jgi:hypothetical protein